MRHVWWLALSATLYGGQAVAQDCGSLNTQFGINQCYQLEYEKADGALQAVYNRLRDSMTPAGKVRLRDAQRAWIGFRDTWCELETSAVRQGSMYSGQVAACLMKLTNEQVDRLTYQATCEEDVDCARFVE